MHSADHSLYTLRKLLVPFVELEPAYYVHNGRKRHSQQESEHDRQGRDVSQEVEVLS